MLFKPTTVCILIIYGLALLNDEMLAWRTLIVNCILIMSKNIMHTSFCNNIIIGKRKLVQSGYYHLLYPVHYVLMTTYRRPVHTRL